MMPGTIAALIIASGEARRMRGRPTATANCADGSGAWIGAPSPTSHAGIGMRHVDFAVTACDPFRNVHTPEDLAVARAIAERDT